MRRVDAQSTVDTMENLATTRIEPRLPKTLTRINFRFMVYIRCENDTIASAQSVVRNSA